MGDITGIPKLVAILLTPTLQRFIYFKEVNLNMNIKNLIIEFIELIKNNKIEIYNEINIQCELAIFLRDKLPNHKIQLERNVSFFELNKKEFEKKEIDIVIFNKTEKMAIELKFPTNGQYPEQMFSFAKDIKFLEELKKKHFKTNLFITFANDKNFWSDKGNEGSIYYLFRNQKRLYGEIQKPTGKKDKIISLKNAYSIHWKDIQNNLKYFIVEI